jgi:hypothetical protein
VVGHNRPVAYSLKRTFVGLIQPETSQMICKSTSPLSPCSTNWRLSQLLCHWFVAKVPDIAVIAHHANTPPNQDANWNRYENPSQQNLNHHPLRLLAINSLEVKHALEYTSNALIV